MSDIQYNDVTMHVEEAVKKCTEASALVSEGLKIIHENNLQYTPEYYQRLISFGYKLNEIYLLMKL